MTMIDTQVPKALKNFVLTQEFKRFGEFAVSCTEFRYIGICHGDPGVGKSLAALHYTNWKEELIDENLMEKTISPKSKKSIGCCKGVLVTVPVTNTPKIIKKEISKRTFGYGVAKLKAGGERDPLTRIKKPMNNANW